MVILNPCLTHERIGSVFTGVLSDSVLRSWLLLASLPCLLGQTYHTLFYNAFVASLILMYFSQSCKLKTKQKTKQQQHCYTVD